MSLTTFPPIGSSRRYSVSGFNTGVLNTVSSAFDVSRHKYICVQVVQASGTITGAVVTVDKSNDGTNWVLSSSTVSAANLTDNIQVTSTYVRLNVTTASAVASTANVTIQCKN